MRREVSPRSRVTCRPPRSPPIELRHLRYFIAVAQHLNFSRAAIALATAQPSLSQQIMQLEREIGVDLFARGKRHIALTPAGHEFLGEARAIIEQVERAVAHAREAGRGLRGELRLAYTFSAMMTTLPAAIREYRADHPDVRITLRAMGSGEVLAALRDHQADAGVLLTGGSLTSSPAIDVRGLGTLPIGTMLPAAHRLAGRTAIAIEDIGADTLILFGRQLAEIYDVVLALCRARHFKPVRVDEVDRMETIAGLVAAGEGVSIVPRIYETLRFPGVVYTALTPEPEPFAIAVARNTSANAALTVAFAQTCERVAAAQRAGATQ